MYDRDNIRGTQRQSKYNYRFHRYQGRIHPLKALRDARVDDGDGDTIM